VLILRIGITNQTFQRNILIDEIRKSSTKKEIRTIICRSESRSLNLRTNVVHISMDKRTHHMPCKIKPREWTHSESCSLCIPRFQIVNIEVRPHRKIIDHKYARVRIETELRTVLTSVKVNPSPHYPITFIGLC